MPLRTSYAISGTDARVSHYQAKGLMSHHHLTLSSGERVFTTSNAITYDKYTINALADTNGPAVDPGTVLCVGRDFSGTDASVMIRMGATAQRYSRWVSDTAVATMSMQGRNHIASTATATVGARDPGTKLPCLVLNM